MKHIGAYLETLGAVRPSEQVPIVALMRNGKLNSGICLAHNLDSWVDCPRTKTSSGSTVYPIYTYSEHYLTNKILWWHDYAACVWRENGRHSAVWHSLPISEFTRTSGGYTDVFSNVQQVSGGDVKYLTIGNSRNASAVNTVFAGKAEAGTFEYTRYEGATQTTTTSQVSTKTNFVGAGETGGYADIRGDWGHQGVPNSDLTPDIVKGEVLPFSQEQIPLEDYDGYQNYSGTDTAYTAMEWFAINDFLGVTDEVCFIKYKSGSTSTYADRVNGKATTFGRSFMYIPIARTSGYAHLTAKAKIIAQEGNSDQSSLNVVGVGAAAVVQGVLQEARQRNTTNTDWTDLSVDISGLPYVDYLVIYGYLGHSAIKDISLTLT